MIHGMSANAIGVRGFDYYIPAQIGNFRTVIALGEVFELQRRIESQTPGISHLWANSTAPRRNDEAFLGL